MTPRHVLVHQFDPLGHVAGGIDGYIRDFVGRAPAGTRIALIGVTNERSVPLGRWVRVEVGKRSVPFMAVARLSSGDPRRVPHSLRLVAGVARFRPHLGDAWIHAQRAELGLALNLLYPRTPLVQFIQGSGKEALSHKVETLWRFLPAVHHAVEKAAVRRASCTLVMHAGAAREFQRISSRVVHAANWYDGEIFKLQPEPVTGSFGWAGRLEAPKDPLLAVETFRVLAERSYPFSAWIAGAGTFEPALRTAIASAGLESRVRFVGLLSPEELAARLGETSVLLMTSHWEGAPRGALEALACGTPVASTAVGDLPLMVGPEGGLLEESRDPERLADHLAALDGCATRDRVAASVERFELGTVVDDLFATIAAAEPRR